MATYMGTPVCTFLSGKLICVVQMSARALRLIRTWHTVHRITSKKQNHVFNPLELGAQALTDFAVCTGTCNEENWTSNTNNIDK